VWQLPFKKLNRERRGIKDYKNLLQKVVFHTAVLGNLRFPADSQVQENKQVQKVGIKP